MRQKWTTRAALVFIFLGLFAFISGSGWSQSQSDIRGAAGAHLSPSQLAQIAPNISADQVVGHPFLPPAQLFLLDDTGAFVMDYDIAADPITMSVSRGILSQTVLSDSSLLSGGVVDFMPLSIFFTGKSGPVTLTASNSTDTSQGVILSFSGYNIMKVTGATGDSLANVVVDVPIMANVAVTNGGNLTAAVDPSLKAFFASGGGSVKNFFNPASGGQIDTVSISLPTGGLNPGSDTLVLVLESEYQPGVTPLLVVDTVRLPLEVLPPVTLTVVNDELTPDSVYSNVPFPIGFALEALGLVGPIDSATVTIGLLDPADLTLQSLFSGSIDPVSFDSSIVTFVIDSVEVDSALVNPTGLYGLSLDVSLFAAGNVFQLDTLQIDTLNVVPTTSLVYSPASLLPMKVNAGESAAFTFNLVLGGSTIVYVDDTLSSFNLTGPGFNVNTSLQFQGDSLAPGSNPVSSEEVQIPTSLEGDSLTVAAVIVFGAPGVANRLKLMSDLDSARISVEQLPVIRIIDASIVSFNNSTVNAGQEFEVAVRIANLSMSVQPTFDLLLVSDGESLFDSSFSVAPIAGEDTITVLYPVTAGPNSTASEVFRVEPSPDVEQLPPLNNLASITIQQPATISLSRILFETQQGFVEPGAEFSLAIDLSNIGEAGTDFGLFSLTSNGVPLGLPDPLTDTILVDVTKGLTFIAPPVDTAFSLNFTLTRIPIDANTGLPAPAGDTTFEVNLQVASLNVALEAEVIPAESNLLTPGTDQPLFTLRLTNLGSSAINDVRLESARLSFSDQFNKLANVRSLIQVGNTGFLESGNRVTTATAAGDQLNLLFNDVIVGAGETVDLVLQTRSKIPPDDEFRIRLEDSAIVAEVVAGPLAGEPVAILTGEPNGLLILQSYTGIGRTLGESFVVETNPYDPNGGPVEFRYFLESSGAVEFRILTLVGEEVYSVDFSENSPGGQSGQNSVSWDGRNDKGHIVLNGVYIVVITQPGSDSRATLKLAVAK